MLCFKKKLECVGDVSHRCTRCLGTAFYCKGPIVTPDLVNLKSMYEKAASASGHHPEGSVPASGALTLDLSLRPLPEATTGSIRDFKFTVESSTDNLSDWDASPINDMLDALVAVDYLPDWDASLSNDVLGAPVDVKTVEVDSNFLYDLTLFKRQCRRFCHCLAMLRCFDRCTLFLDNIDHPTAVRFVAGFICQLSRVAQTLFNGIFNEVRACCSAKRQRGPTQKLMFDLADHLGEICKEMSALNETLMHGRHPPLFDGFFLDAAKTLRDIENIARGLRVEDTNFANRSAPLQFGGLCAKLLSAPPLVGGSGFDRSATEVSFLEVIAGFSSLLPCTNTSVDASLGNPTSDNVGLVPPTSSDTSYSEYGLTGEKDPQPLTVDRGMTSNGIASEPIDWEALANAGLNPEWTVRLDDFNPRSNDPIPPSPSQFLACGTTPQYTHAEPLADQGHHDDKAFPTYTGFDDDITTGLPTMTSPLRSNTCMRDGLDTTESANSGALGQAGVSISQTTQGPASKRKRMTSLLPRKKQHVLPSSSRPATNREDERHNAQSTSRPQIQSHTDSPPRLTHIARGLAQFKRLSNVYRPRIIKTDWVTGWDNGGTRDCDIVRDVNVPEHQRRPVSWPLRQHIRNSVDISVAVLGKLRIDGGPGI